ncbi:MAG: methionine gamma-lyase family protein, partial [Clostridia bacterium]|nr:methionine gamma-lyase family protein [Clostridia bacterium]
IEYREVDFDYNAPNPQTVVDAIKANTKIVALQRSKGYNWRASLSIAVLADLISAVKKAYPSVIVFVDNCYGEFVETKEPPEVGADLIAGSLIKNPGGGLAPCGGYVAGKADLVERAAARLTSPGIGKEIGPSLMDQRLYYQGLFMAPSVVGEALRGAVFAACLWHELGFKVLPHYEENRTDIIQAIELKEKERLLAFCRGIQKYAPIDSYVTPMPWDMPGYTSQVIMAAGTFVQGSSIELSADAPVKEPYIVYFQGGLNRYHAKTAVSRTAKDMLEAGLI